MTRREELLEKIESILEKCTDIEDEYGYWYIKRDADIQEELLNFCIQVERECWQRVTEKIETEMAKEDGSTDDQIWEIRDWCDEQGKIT